MSTKVAVVTGSNKGIGFAIVRGLCKQFQGDVYLTARDVGRGQQAVEDLKKEGLNPKFHQLDITDKASIEVLRNFLQENYGGLDILVNNAAIAFKSKDPTPFLQQTEESQRVNYYSVLNMCDAMFPILRAGARVAHVSSMAATYFMNRSSPDKKSRFVASRSITEVTALLEEFKKDVKDGKHKERGWADSAYGSSKAGVTAITPIQQATVDKERPGCDIVINCCCPGYVNTDMSSHKGHLTPDQGAETPLYLALLPAKEKSIKGRHLTKKEVVNWNSSA